ncbi:MAG TPA: sigma-70 family RNA polymerase sigma factor [Candidatus Udaeobacter sp.]
MLRPREVVIDQELSNTAALLPAAELSGLPSEDQMIAKCRAGNAAAWDSLFDKYYATVARFVFQLSGDFSHEDTEEICQETFLSVVRNLSSFQGRSSFQTWLLRIAANKAMDYRGKTRAVKRGGNAVHIPIDAGRTNDEPPIDPPSGNPGPDALLQIAETSRLVRESLDRLGEPCREIIELRYFGELSYDDIAAELRLNPKTVSSRLSKCLDRLLVVAQEIFPSDNRLPSNL